MIKFLILISLLAGVLMMQPQKAQAFDFFKSTCSSNVTATNGPNKGQTSPVCDQNNTQGDKNPAINIIRITTTTFALLAGLLAVIMIIGSGFQMVTSAGNADRVSSARKRLVNSVIGVALVALAWTIIRFVTDRIIQG